MLQTNQIPVDIRANERHEQLPEGAHIERREDGSVWQVQIVPETLEMNPKSPLYGQPKDGPDTLEFRVDSVKDPDFISKGGTPWYYKFLDEVAPNTGRAQDVNQQLATLTARLDAAEARAAAAEAALPTPEAPAEVEAPSPPPQTPIRKTKGRGHTRVKK